MKLRPNKFEYNIIVIGAGSGGLVAAYIAAAINARVALVEKNIMGGDCLNTGCVPSKAIISSSQFVHSVKNASKFGMNYAQVDFDFSKVMERVQDVISQIRPHDSIERYSKLGVECFNGNAEIIDRHRVKVNDIELTTMNIIIATGAAPIVPKFKGLENVNYVTSDTIWEIRSKPEKLVVLGGGPIGSELSQTFSRLGSKVTIVNRGKHILGKEDEDISRFVENKFKEEGIEILNKQEPLEFEDNTMILSDGVKIEFDLLLIALGRVPNVKGLGLERVGVEISSFGTIGINEFVQTNIPNIYACGDVAGPFQFTHFASHQASCAALNSLFRPFKKFKVDYKALPWCTFTDPEVATVGLNEYSARNINYEVTLFDIKDLDRAITDECAYGMVKVLTEKGSDKILGATIVSKHAGNLIQEFVIAIKYGLGLKKILNTIHPYPSMVEMNRFVAGNWRKSHVSGLLKKISKKYFAWKRGANILFF